MALIVSTNTFPLQLHLENNMTKKLTDRNTKPEILAAYQELAKEKSVLEAQLRQAKSAQPVVAASEPKVPEKALTLTNPKIIEQKQMKDTIAQLLNVQSHFGSSISNLSEKLTLEASKLAELREQVAEELQELNQLHNLEEVEEGTLETLIQDYEDSDKQFADEFERRREALEQEIGQQKESWNKEQEEHQRFVKERDDTAQKAQKRDAEEYHYDRELERHIDADRYEQTQEQLYREMADMQQQQEKNWTEREKAIADREKQFHEVKAKVEEHPKELEANIKRGKENGRNIAHYQAKVKADLRQKEIEGQRQFSELRLQSLSATIESQNIRLQSLSKQLDSALKQVQDLAVKAIDGAANANSLQTMKDIALEQAKNQQRMK
jgi:hypothetical protein